jgi:hypothetical protein
LVAGLETSDVEAVLDGDIDAFLMAYLRWRGEQQSSEALAGAQAASAV